MALEETPRALPGDLSQFGTLVAIIARLRAPDGCPWDREQTHASVRDSLLEECYEVLEALDEGEAGRLCLELGDLLMQVVFHAQIAAEAGEFRLADVIRGINEKLVRRHPHVFGAARVNGSDEVRHNWEAIKKEERGGDISMLASVPRQLPALTYSQEVQGRAARAGFDWEDTAGVIDKLVEEVDEYRRAEDPAEKEAEFGDVLFTLANIARREGIDLEAALRRANRRFYRRFSGMEALCRRRGLTFGKLSFDQQNALGEEAKKEVG
ncbi:MAG: nucleoside triphosphate pyrophosphohydrolase [Chloroflexota bacterium]